MDVVKRFLNTHSAHCNGAETAELGAVRKAALARFAQTGFPNTKIEEWKYTSTKSLQNTAFVLDDTTTPLDTPKDLDFAGKTSTQLVFLNGRLHRQWSRLPQESAVTIKEWGEPGGPQQLVDVGQIETADPFSSLNLAFVQDAVHIEIASKANIETPIHLLFIGQATDTPIGSHPRVVITAGAHSEVEVIQTHMGLGDAPAWINGVVHTFVQENATVRHSLIHQGDERLHYVGNILAEVERDGRYISHTFWLGGALSRNDLVVNLNGSGAETDLYGLYLCDGVEHLDNHTVVEHRVPHCRSNELYKGVLAGKSKAVFNGRIVVHKDAQKTDSQQSNRNLLLSEKATINTKPELEIYADDVSCAHGTTVGQMDEEAIFYLQSRGIGRDQAKAMLTQAFCMDLLTVIPNESLREQLRTKIEERLIDIIQEPS
jgi:Fe-S cluster assembly protein SufD